MRRPVMYLAGLLLATGASLALAGPASAAPSHHCHNGNHADWWYPGYSDNDSYNYDGHSSVDQNNDSHYSGIVLLSGNSGNGDGGLFGGGGLL
jgi:hypothetical protein